MFGNENVIVGADLRTSRFPMRPVPFPKEQALSNFNGKDNTMKPFILSALLFSGLPVQAQHEHAGHAMENGKKESPAMLGFYGPYSMSREASGTAWLPESSPHAGSHWMAGDWMGMFHGYVYGISTHQGGPRGEDRVFGENMTMV